MHSTNVGLDHVSLIIVQPVLGTMVSSFYPLLRVLGLDRVGSEDQVWGPGGGVLGDHM